MIADWIYSEGFEFGVWLLRKMIEVEVDGVETSGRRDLIYEIA